MGAGAHHEARLDRQLLDGPLHGGLGQLPSTPASSKRTRPGLTTATQCSGLPLPEPMRVSAGFWVTGLSGNTRIQTLPPRRTWRVIAIRAASIWRAVSQPGSSAWMPKSPKLTVVAALGDAGQASALLLAVPHLAGHEHPQSTSLRKCGASWC